MKVGIIGAGISGIFLAVLLKKYDPNMDLTLIDVNDTLGKKFLKTGNGRCNLGNETISEVTYNDEVTKSIVEEFPLEDQVAFYNSIGLEVADINGLYYPFSLSASSLLDYLVSYLNERKIKKVLGSDVNDYQILDKGEILVRSSKRDPIFDKLVIATGGNSSIPPSIKRQSVFTILKKHGYEVSNLLPGLCPIVTIEPTKKLEDIRVKCKASLIATSSRKVKYEENGEVIFKKDGLSGICIFNIASLLQRDNLNGNAVKTTISLDLMPNVSEDELCLKLERYNSIALKSCLYGIFNATLADYIWERAQVNNLYKFTKLEIKKLAKTIKNLTFTPKAFYDFDSSQVTIGGLEYKNVNVKTLESNLEPNVYFAGEVLNADGLCGGYNIMFALASAYKVYLAITKEAS